MRKKLFVSLFVLVTIVAVGCYIVYGFHKIELDAAPYMTKRSQVEKLLEDNRQIFEKLVAELNIYDNFYYQYNSSFGRELVIEQWKNVTFIDDLMYIFASLDINIIRKTDNFISFQQVNPIGKSDVYIGMSFYYESNEWRYCYYHVSNFVDLDNKWVYKLYDVIYNRGVGDTLTLVN